MRRSLGYGTPKCPPRIENLASPSAASAGARRSTSRRFCATRTPRSPGCARATPTAPARNLASYGVALPGARITTSYDEVLAAPDVDIVSIATPNHLHAEQAVAAARAGKHLLLEKPTGLDVDELVRIRDAVRRAGVRTIVSFELRYNPFLTFARWLRDRRLARRDPLRAHAVPVARHRLVQRMGLGAHARERAQPPARGRLPRGRCAALVLRPGADVGERVAYAVHRGLRVADVDRRQHDPRRFRARPRDQLHRFHAAVYVPRRADGRPGDLAAGPAAVARPADRAGAAGGGESVSGRSARAGHRCRPAGRRSASSARCPTRPT